MRRRAWQRTPRRANALTEARRLAAAFEAMSDAVLIFDATGRIQRAHTAPRSDLGTELDLRSAHAREQDALPAAHDEGEPAPPWAQEPISRVLRGEILSGAQAIDITLRAADGRTVQVSVGGAPLRDGQGRVTGGILVAHDITARWQSGRRTRQALEALLTMAETMVQGSDGAHGRSTTQAIVHSLGVLTCEVLECRSAGIIAVQSTGALYPLDCVGLPVARQEQWRERVLNWPYASDLFRGIVARLRTGEIVCIDTTTQDHQSMANPFGIMRYLLAPMRIGTALVGMLSLNYGTSPLPEARGDLALIEAIGKLAALVLERDRLQQERAEARARALALEEANRRMDEFLGIAGHEMRTPLTSISGHIQLAQRRATRLIEQGDVPLPALLLDLDAIQRQLARTEGGLTRINHLVGDLLDVSRIQSGHLAIAPAPADLAALVATVVHEHLDLAAGHTIRLHNLPGETVPVCVDVERIGQVLTNYLANACKYAPPETPVTVGLDVEQAVVRVWVRDEGPGVPAAEQGRIWERFYRAAGVERHHGSRIGLGLGLHISRSIIERHGGQVGVESEPGAGATFWFTVPLSPPC